MDFKGLLRSKRQELEERLAEIDSLRDEVTTLEKAVALADKYGVDLTARDAALAQRSKKAERKRRPDRKKPTGITLADGIRQAIRELTPPFTIAMVRDRLDPSLYKSPTSIASTMRRLADDEELSIIEKGGPGKGVLYGLPPTNRELTFHAPSQSRPENRREKIGEVEVKGP